MHRSNIRISAIHDEGQAYSIIVEASSDSFAGYAECILDPTELQTACNAMMRFPENGLDSRISWILKSWSDEPNSRIDFFIKDGLGHASAHVLLHQKVSGLLQMAEFHIPLEVAAINQLGSDLLGLLEYPLKRDQFEIQSKG
jgi:hypothetical protein